MFPGQDIAFTLAKFDLKKNNNSVLLLNLGAYSVIPKWIISTLGAWPVNTFSCYMSCHCKNIPRGWKTAVLQHVMSGLELSYFNWVWGWWTTNSTQIQIEYQLHYLKQSSYCCGKQLVWVFWVFFVVSMDYMMTSVPPIIVSIPVAVHCTCYFRELLTFLMYWSLGP